MMRISDYPRDVSFGRSLLLLLFLGPSLSGSAWHRIAKIAPTESPNLTAPPEFDDIAAIREIEAAKGQTLLLPCTVRNLGDKVVSWIRKRDLLILTSGPLTFSADSRFESVYSSNRDFWGLRIRGARISDTGQYECQVNTHPKMSLAINLTVTAENPPKIYTRYLHKASIKGPNEVYTHEGSPVTITCEITPLIIPVTQAGASLDYSYNGARLFPTKARVQWFHGQKEVLSGPFETDRGIVSIETDRVDQLTVRSQLKISKVTHLNEGVYTCRAASTLSNSVKLFVAEYEHTEAMQSDFPQVPSGTSNLQLTLPLILMKIILDYF